MNMKKILTYMGILTGGIVLGSFIVIMVVATLWQEPGMAPPHGNVLPPLTQDPIFIDVGNVGIGTTAPISPLQVAGTITLGTTLTAGTVGNVQITGAAGSPVSGRLLFGTDGTGWQFRIAQNQAGTITDLVTVLTGGNVGIGTTAPGANLHIRGTTPVLRVESTSNVNEATIDFRTPAGRTARLVSKYTNPAASTETYLAFHTNVHGSPNDTVAEAMRIKGGNVGIGTPTPDSKLDVEGGDIRISTQGKRLIFPDGSYQTAAVNLAMMIRSCRTGNGSVTCSVDCLPGELRTGCNCGPVVGFVGGVLGCRSWGTLGCRVFLANTGAPDAFAHAYCLSVD